MLANVSANLVIFLVYTTIPALLALFRLQKTAPTFFREGRLALWFASFIFWCGQTHLWRAVSFIWPAYRLSTLILGITAVISWVTLTVMVPLMLETIQQRIREERHDFANKVNAVQLNAQVATQRLQQATESVAKHDQDLTRVIAELGSILRALGHGEERPGAAP